MFHDVMHDQNANGSKKYGGTMTVEIRKASIFDIPYLSEICLQTGFSGKDASDLYSDPYMLSQFYAVPYVAYSTDHCYVVEAELNSIIRPVGYIVGVENTTKFTTWLEEEWMMQLRKSYHLNGSYHSESERSFIELIQNTIIVEEGIVMRYPAHFHMNVLPVFQGRGYRRKLTEILWDSLKNKGVAGVHMGFAADKAGAFAFYKEMGYTELKTTSWGVYMGYLF
jgi:ribosomal protein S18 acetylase RimI-like enzyme